MAHDNRFTFSVTQTPLLPHRDAQFEQQVVSTVPMSKCTESLPRYFCQRALEQVHLNIYYRMDFMINCSFKVNFYTWLLFHRDVKFKFSSKIDAFNPNGAFLFFLFFFLTILPFIQKDFLSYAGLMANIGDVFQIDAPPQFALQLDFNISQRNGIIFHNLLLFEVPAICQLSLSSSHECFLQSQLSDSNLTTQAC